jgi:hypothetical protein
MGTQRGGFQRLLERVSSRLQYLSQRASLSPPLLVSLSPLLLGCLLPAGHEVSHPVGSLSGGWDVNDL